MYKYGEKPDVLIFQKVLMTYDYQLHKHFEGIKILDICDPEWSQSPDVLLKGTLDNVDAVVVPTQEWADYLLTMTDKPVRVIRDRFDLSELPKPKSHHGVIRNAVWFGYSHNSLSMEFVVRSLERRGIGLIAVSDNDPMLWRWAEDKEKYQKKYKYLKYEHPKAYKDIQEADIAVLPLGKRPFDRFKSENKTILAQLLGLPVVNDSEELEKMNNPANRNNAIDFGKLKAEYNVKKSIREWKELIREISLKRR